MNLYVLSRVGYLTPEYHSAGGLVVIANDRGHARRLLERHAEEAYNFAPDGWTPTITDEEWGRAKVYEVDAEPAVFVFPDAGCC